MSDLLKGHRALITGCNRGIGRAILEAYASEGCDVWAHSRKEVADFVVECQELADKYGVEVMPAFFDITDRDAVKKIIKDIMKSKRIPDILVNNAGVMATSSFFMTTEETLHNQLDVNFVSMYMLTQSVSRLMLRSNGGSIINLASFQGESGAAGKSAYGASKAAVRVFTESISEELAKQGIRVNAIAPGVINTDMIKGVDETIIQKAVSLTDMGRIGNPEEIAKVAVFLASDMSSYVTGQVIRVDGGLKT